MKRTPILPLLLIMLLLISCDRQLSKSLELAGDNRAEMEKVLEHFKHDPDPLKYKAAKFLIENMPYHYSYEGEAVEKYDSAYLRMAEEPKQFRDSVFGLLTQNIAINDRKCIDIATLKAEYLIQAIDDACNVWSEATWHGDFDESVFFDYVLPYRILNEPLTNWRDCINAEYTYLSANEVQSKRGEQIEAENVQYGNCKIVDKASASNGQAAMLRDSCNVVTFEYESSTCSKKVIHLRYTSISRNAQVSIVHNGKNVASLSLEPTNTMDVFRDTRKGADVVLQPGKNTISISAKSGTVGLDYVQFTSVENYKEATQTDFSTAYCRIQNKSTQECISFDTLQSSLLNAVATKPYASNDSTIMLRLDFLGYGSWKVASFRHDSIDLCMESAYCHTYPTSAVTQYKFINGNNQKWVFLPVETGYFKIMNKDSGLCLEPSHDSTSGKDTLMQSRYMNKDSQKWKIERLGARKDNANDLFIIRNSISAALKIFDVTNQYEWIAYDSPLPPKASSLCKGRTGNCRDEASYAVYLCRYLGIPAAVDFTPHWGNRSQSHSWSVLIKPDGTSTPFYMGCAPGDTAHYYHSYKKPKVFRHRFSLNRDIVADLREERDVPSLFFYPDFIDVTDEYYETTDIVRPIPQEWEDSASAAYICVFDNREWVPVHYGKIRNGKATFSSMARGIMYMSAFFRGGKVVPFGNPYYVDSVGTIHEIQADFSKKQRMTLLRKYPFMGKEDFFNLRINEGRFQGANKENFDDAATLYQYFGIPEGNWISVPVNDTRRYKYLRYIGPPASYCNINELEFYDREGNKVVGTIIGTEGEPWGTKEKVFDGDILTGFSGVSPDGHWVGLRVKQPVAVGRIRFIPRNDGNGIEIGDLYSLYIWNRQDWECLKTIKATSNELMLNDIPSGGLYVLRDLTKGHEERIFTYENNKQVWW